MMHRIREALAAGKLPIMGGPRGVVEIDETCIGKKERVPVALIARPLGRKYESDQ